MLNNRQIDIIEYLKDKDDYVTIRQLAGQFDVSPRTVRNDLDDIQYYLGEEPVILERKPRAGIRLYAREGYDLDRILAKERYHDYSPQERCYMILVLLIMQGKTTIEELESHLQVSKNTVVADIRRLEELLAGSGIHLQKKSWYGMEICGEEKDIRNLLFNIHIHAASSFHVDIIQFIRDYALVDPQIAGDLISYVEYMGEIRYSGEAVQELQGMLLASLQRMKLGHHVEVPEKEQQEEDRLYLYIHKFFQSFEPFSMTDGDAWYLVMLFRSTKSLSGKRTGDPGEEKKISELCRQMIDAFAQKVGITVHAGDEVCENLIMHLKVAIFRLRSRIRIANPMLGEIRYASSVMYGITQDILRRYEESCGVHFPEEEIAFITIYFEMLYQNCSRERTRLKVIIVCNGGIATSTLLRQRLSTFLPELPVYQIFRAADIREKIGEVRPDFVISTVPLELPGYPVIRVNPILNAADINRLTSAITDISWKKQNQQLILHLEKQQENRIENLIPPGHCQFEQESEDWREAIHMAAAPLVRDYCVEPAYVDDMIRVVEEMGNYMIFIPEIAFVHASPKHVLHTSIAVMNLKKKLVFGSKTKSDVKVIVVIANEEENHILANLIQLLLADDNIERFKEAESYDDLRKLKEEGQ